MQMCGKRTDPARYLGSFLPIDRATNYGLLVSLVRPLAHGDPISRPLLPPLHGPEKPRPLPRSGGAFFLARIRVGNNRWRLPVEQLLGNQDNREVIP